MQVFQNIDLRKIINALFFISNLILQEYLGIKPVIDESEFIKLENHK